MRRGRGGHESRDRGRHSTGLTYRDEGKEGIEPGAYRLMDECIWARECKETAEDLEVWADIEIGREHRTRTGIEARAGARFTI